MIAKVTRGSDIGGLLRYLYGPGKANEHTNPHLVASWRGDDRAQLDPLEPSPGRSRQKFAHLADRLNLPLSLLPVFPDKQVWQCSMRLADGDRQLSDAEWAQVAREVVQSTGFAPVNDPGGCRWVAVRHSEDHIHVVVTLARQDGQPVDSFRDWPKVHAAARTIEQRFGLATVPSPNRTATVAPVRGEVEKASRVGQSESARVWLTREVRVAAAGSGSREEFESLLALEPGLVLGWRYSQKNPGQVTGYRVGREGDVDRSGNQVWFSGSKLSPDLSLPKLEARWTEIGTTSDHLQRNDERQSILNGAALALGRGAMDAPHPGIAISAGEVATILARIAEGGGGGPLTNAADALARGARQPSGTRPPVNHRVHPLRHTAVGLAQLGRVMPREVSEVIVIVAHLMELAAVLHERNAAGSASRAFPHALSYYAQYVGPVSKSQQQQLRSALGETLARQILSDPAWPALAAQLRQIEAANGESMSALRRIAGARELRSAASITSVLHHRMKVGASSAMASTSADFGRSPARPRPERSPDVVVRGRAQSAPPSK